MVRTEKFIVDQTNKLARQFAALAGWKADSSFQFYKSSNPRASLYWEMAVMAQEVLTKTDVTNALTQCD